MSVSAPSIKTHMEPSPAVAEFVPPLSGHGTSGVGMQLSPGRCGSPAEAGRTDARSAHTASAQGSKILLTVDSPIEVVKGRGRFATKTVHTNTEADPDLVQFRTLVAAKQFDSLTQLCLERLLAGRDPLRWTKDLAIVEAMQGKYLDAFKLLAARYADAVRVTGIIRGKYEQEMGISLARLRRPSLAIDHFNVAYQHLYFAGHRDMCAYVDTARARALVTRGETLKALRYLDRAETVATKFRNYELLQMIAETKAEAYGELAGKDCR